MFAEFPNLEVLDFAGLCWPSLAFVVFVAFVALIDLFATIRCQNQFPNKIGHFDSLCNLDIFEIKSLSLG